MHATVYHIHAHIHIQFFQFPFHMIVLTGWAYSIYVFNLHLYPIMHSGTLQVAGEPHFRLAMYLFRIFLLPSLHILLLEPIQCFPSANLTVPCERPYYLTSSTCSENCPFGTVGDADTRVCEECKFSLCHATIYSEASRCVPLHVDWLYALYHVEMQCNALGKTWSSDSFMISLY